MNMEKVHRRALDLVLAFTLKLATIAVALIAGVGITAVLAIGYLAVVVTAPVWASVTVYRGITRKA